MATGQLGPGTQLVSFERPVPAREVGLVYRREHHKTQLIDALADSILKAIPEEIRKIKPKDLEVLPA
jgi:LysR family hydrogen peroxide-inducible transcriptional activator